MASSQDTEITLGTGKLLVLFFGLVGICALFFALGYSLGRKSEPTVAAASAAVPPQVSPNTSKANGGSASAPMTFYKAVEQKNANPELTTPADSKTEQCFTSEYYFAKPRHQTASIQRRRFQRSSYFVQVAAVSKQEDADALVDALKKKEYSAFVAPVTAVDKLFRVQVGPFSTSKTRNLCAAS